MKGCVKLPEKDKADDEPLCDWRRVVEVEELEGAVCSHDDMLERFKLSMFR